MNLSENIRLAWEGLRSNKMRAVLTMLGIIIGIASVIGILTVGDGMSGAIKNSMGSLGATNITLFISAKNDSDTAVYDEDDLITDSMLNALKEKYPDEIAGIYISESVGSGKVSRGRADSFVNVSGINDQYLDVNDVKILRGRGILEKDNTGTRNVAVVSDKLVDELFGGDAAQALGEEISAPVGTKSYKFSIVGIYEYEQEDSMRPPSVTGATYTDLYIPLQTAKQLSDSGEGYSGVGISVTDSVDSTVFAGQVEAFLNKYYQKNEDWQIVARSMASMLETLQSMMGTISTALSVIAGISLVVGGIGVMNIMLVSVTERTREIGTRKAIGATNANIRVQFVVESVIVCLIGGMIGVVLGAALGYVGSNLMDIPTFPSFGSVMLALGFSIGIGIFFGYYPANKAAKLDPIEALRYE